MKLLHRMTGPLFLTVQIMLALLFFWMGATKFDPDDMRWMRVFSLIGIGQWFRYFVGAVELIGAILLLIPRFSVIGAGLLAGVMFGAVNTNHWIFDDSYAVRRDGCLFFLLIAIAWKRRTLPVVGLSKE